MSKIGDFTDIHCHILPSLDDGSKNLEQSKDMLITAYNEGIRRIIATPHNYVSHKSASVKRIEETVLQLNAYAKEWNIPISIYCGNEIYYRDGVTGLLEEKKVLTLAGSRYVLVEFDTYVDYSYLRDGLMGLAYYGYYPILAHAERYDCLFRGKDRLRELKKAGIYIQVNTATFLEGFTSEYKKRAKLLLKEECVDFIATDAHSNRTRAPKIRQSATYLYKKLGKDRAKEILEDNPEAIIKNRRI